ncbi:phosphomannose isomerase type I family protein, partial [Vibrio parahaemolyticus V-223/04]
KLASDPRDWVRQFIPFID